MRVHECGHAEAQPGSGVQQAAAQFCKLRGHTVACLSWTLPAMCLFVAAFTQRDQKYPSSINILSSAHGPPSAAGFTCSAGIAHNKLLAKLGSAMHKPNQQTVVCWR